MRLNLKHILKYSLDSIPNFVLSHSIPPELQTILTFLKGRSSGIRGIPWTPKNRIVSIPKKQFVVKYFHGGRRMHNGT